MFNFTIKSGMYKRCIVFPYFGCTKVPECNSSWNGRWTYYFHIVLHQN